MKIVDRKTFLSMPEGTVFCKIQTHCATKDDNCISDFGWDYVFGLTSPKIKGESFGDDFYVQGLGDMSPIGGKCSDDYFDALYDMSKDQNKEIPFELCGGRDGLYETNNVQFAIFSKDEVEEIIRELQTALKKGYSV